MESNPPQRRQLPLGLRVVLLPLWWLITLLMVLSAVLGLVCVIVGVISFFVEGGFLGMRLGGEAVQTPTQKVLFISVGAAVGVAGIGFWWLRQRGYVVGALIVYALLLAFVLAIGWFTGGSSIISL